MFFWQLDNIREIEVFSLIGAQQLKRRAGSWWQLPPEHRRDENTFSLVLTIKEEGFNLLEQGAKHWEVKQMKPSDHRLRGATIGIAIKGSNVVRHTAILADIYGWLEIDKPFQVRDTVSLVSWHPIEKLRVLQMTTGWMT